MVAVQVFARAPEPGEAKTRLIPALGAEGAARLHRRLVEDTVRTARQARIGPVTMWCTPDPSHPDLVALAERHGAGLATQRGAGLGERMHDALRDGLSTCRGALVVGSDCPFLTAADLADAASLLAAGRDAVIGPASDGGYYLLAVKRADEALFSAIAWGTSGVLQATRARMQRLGWHWSELATKSDIDRPEDLALLPFRPPASVSKRCGDGSRARNR